MSDLDNFPLGFFGLAFLLEPEKGSMPASTVLTGARDMAVGPPLPASLVRLIAMESYYSNEHPTHLHNQVATHLPSSLSLGV